VTIYADEVLADNPVGFWLLDEASGATAAAVVGADGTYTATGITYEEDGPSPTIPAAIATNGTTGDVSLSTPALGTAQPQSFEVWYYTPTTISSSTGNTRLIGANAGALAQANGPLYLGNFTSAFANEVVGVSNDEGGSGARTGWTGFTIPAGWHHIAVTYDGTQNGWTLYLDGAATGTKVSASGGCFGLSGSQPFTVGAFTANGTTSRSAVTVAALAIYDTELSADRVLAHYGAAFFLPTYEAHVLGRAPLHYWKLDEPTGTSAEDLGAVGADGTYTNGPTLAAGELIVGANPVAHFDGTNDSVNITGLTTASSPAKLTGVAWIRKDDADRGVIIGRDSGSGTRAFFWEIGTNGKLNFLTAGSSGAYASTRDDLDDGEVHQIGFTYSNVGPTLEFYIDGELDSSRTVAQPPSTTSTESIYLGRHQTAGYYFGGLIGHVALFPTILTATDFRALYRAGLADLYGATVVDTGPVGYWPLQEDTGSTATDLSGNGHHGTYNGSPALATRDLGTPALGTVSDFDGTNDFVLTPAIGASAGARSAEAWVEADVLTSALTFLSERFTGSSNPVEMRLGIGPFASGSNTRFAVSRFNGSSWADLQDPATPSTGTLYHVVGTHDGTTMRLYVNGAQVASMTTTLNPSDDGWNIGRNHATGGYWDGAIGHVAIYPSALTAGQVAAHYLAGTYAPGADLPPELLEVDFVAEGTFAATMRDAVRLSAAFVAEGTFAPVLTPHEIMPPVDFRARSEFTPHIRPRGTRRRTVIVDAEGNTFGEVADAKHGPITWELNRWETASFSAPIDSPAVDRVLEERIREVHLWRGDQLLVFGPMVRPSATRTELVVDVVGPAWHLSRRHVGKAERTDYVKNGDFEDGRAHWSPYVDAVQTFHAAAGAQYVAPLAEIVRFPVLSGARALKTGNYVEGTANGIAQQFEWTVDPSENPTGDLWTLSGYYYVQSFTAPSAYSGVVLKRYSTVELEPDPFVQAAAPGALLTLQSAHLRIHEDTERGRWHPFTIDLTVPPSGDPEIVAVVMLPPVGVVFFDRLRLTRVETTSFFATDQAEIVGELVAHAQDPDYGKSDVNLDTETPPTGVLRDLVAVHHEHPNIWRLIEDYTDLEDGLDVSVAVTPTRRILRTHFPHQGRHRPELELRLNRNVSGFSWAFDGENAASSIIVLGTGDGSSREEASAIDPAAFAGGLTLEEVFAVPSGTRIELLDKRAAERLVIASAPELLGVKTYANDDNVRGRNFLGRLMVGDTVPVNLSRGRLEITGTYRVVRLTLNGDDTLDLVLNRRVLS